MSELVIRVPGEPFAQPRHRSAPLMRDGKPVLGKGGRPIMIEYDPRGAKNWKATAQAHMIAALPAADPNHYFSDGPVALFVLAVFTCPKSDVRKRDPRPRRWHTKKPDGDNVLKAVKDAAKGVLWLDDSQVARATVTKIIGAQGEAPFVEIRVSELTEEILSQGGDALRNRLEEQPAIHSLSNPAPGDALSPGADLPLFNKRRD